MEKGVFELTLIEMFAIKHALQKQVNIKNKRLEDICTNTKIWDCETDEEFYRLDQDIKHEKELINRLEAQIKICKPIVRV